MKRRSLVLVWAALLTGSGFLGRTLAPSTSLAQCFRKVTGDACCQSNSCSPCLAGACTAAKMLCVNSESCPSDVAAGASNCSIYSVYCFTMHICEPENPGDCDPNTNPCQTGAQYDHSSTYCT